MNAQTPPPDQHSEPTTVESPLDFIMDDIDGKPTDLRQFKGRVVLLINTASKCGLTPQYEQLEQIYQKYKRDGFIILAFPAIRRITALA